jgi:hypothetical protein
MRQFAGQRAVPARQVPLIDRVLIYPRVDAPSISTWAGRLAVAALILAALVYGAVHPQGAPTRGGLTSPDRALQNCYDSAIKPLPLGR